MTGNQEYDRNNAAYHRMKEMLRQTFPKGWFVGIADEQIVGNAASFQDLQCLLQATGRDPRNVLVVEAGVDYPEFANIFI